MRSIRAALASLPAVVLAIVGPAQASATTTRASDVMLNCWGECEVGVDGTITWGQRTAWLSGNVINRNPTPGCVTVYFRAFAGSTVIDRDTRTNCGGADPEDPYVPFGFSIGDPDLVGGVNRIAVYFVWYDQFVDEYSDVTNYYRS